MRINYIELSGYKRLFLRNIHYIKITPETRVQAILGTNGSGKSSILSELSPLPAISNSYLKNGFKIISITHLGSEYLLKSDFNAQNVHSFIKDGEEQNEGGTITVQKELVRRYFNINTEKHELLIGLERFTSMSAVRRREWLTQLSDTNFDYAIKFYNKHKDASRDVLGALKLAKSRLVVETSKIATESDIDSIKKDIQFISNEIQILYNNRNDEERTFNEIDKEQSVLLNELEKLNQQFFINKSYFTNKTFVTIPEYETHIDFLRHEITSIQTKIDFSTKEFRSLKETMDEYTKTGFKSIAELENKIFSIQEDRSKLSRSVKLDILIEQPQQALSVLESIEEALNLALLSLPNNESRYYNPGILSEYQKQYSLIKEKIHSATQRLERLKHNKEHLDQLKNNGSTECPKCTHVWIIGYNQTNYDKLVKVIKEGDDFITENTSLLNNLEKNIAEQNDYISRYNNIIQYFNSTPILKPLWDYLFSEDSLSKSPSNVTRLISIFKRDLDVQIQILDKYKEIQHISDLLLIAKKASNVDIEKVKTKLDTLEIDLGVFNGQLYLTKNKLNESINDKNKLTQILLISDKIKGYISQIEKGIGSSVRALKNDIVNDCIKILLSELAVKQKILNDIEMQKNIVDDIKNTIESLIVSDQALKMILETLSPTDGLIAEGLLSFIKVFLKKVNLIIRKSWSYRMEIQSCTTDIDAGGGLDYKFPVLIQHHDNIAPDIGRTSEGQKEIIDLAFRIIAMKYLGLSDYPLVFDEPTGAMDVEHTVAFGGLLNYLLEESSFSQMFLVSHDYLQYGAIPNIQFCVLCPSNILTPSVYNQHVVIQ